MKKLLYAVTLSVLAIIAMAMPLSASTYYADIIAANASATSYAQLPVIWTIDNNSLASSGYISSTGLDVKFTNTGAQIASMLANDKSLFVLPMSAHTSQTAHMTTGNTAASEMQVVLGYNGYITTADNAALEPSNNFEVAVSGYIDTSAAGKYLVSKSGALYLYTTAASEITGMIVTGTGTAFAQGGVSDGTASVYGATWVGQNFTTSSAANCISATLYVDKVGSPSGNFNVSLYATNGSGNPTGSALQSVSVAASTISGTAANVTFTFTAPYMLSASTKYALVVSTPSGDVSNCIRWYIYTTADLIANATNLNSTNSGSTWAQDSYGAGADFRASVNVETVKTVVGTSITSGAHVIKLSANGTNLYLYDGATQKASTALSGGSVTNTANSWVFMNNNSMAYADYIKLTVASVEKLKYQPVTIVSGTTMPDRNSTQNGVITWGSNPSDVTATSSGGFSAGGASTVIPTTAPPNRPDFFATVSPATDEPLNTTSPFQPVIEAIVNPVNTNSENPTLLNAAMVWTVIWMLGIEGAMVVALKFLSHQIIGVIIGGMGFLAAAKFGSMPAWAFIVFAITGVGIVIMEFKRGKG